MPPGKKLMRRSRPSADTVDTSLKDEIDKGSDKSGETSPSNDKDIEMIHKQSVHEKKDVASSSKVRTKPNQQRLSNSHVLESDLEEQPLLAEDIEDFLSSGVSSGDPFEGHYEGEKIQWEYQHDRRGGHVLFIENEDTGELVLADLNGDGGAGGSGEQGGDFEESPLLGDSGENSNLRAQIPGSSSEEFSLMEKFFLAACLFFQGLVAGFSLALVYLVEQADSDFDLLVNYQPSSNEIRRILFIFGAVSFVGALELFSYSWRRRRNVALVSGLSDGGIKRAGREHINNRNVAGTEDSAVTHALLERLLLPLTGLTLLCFFTFFVILLVMAPTEVLMSKKNGYSGGDDASQPDEWAELALDDTKFESLFSRWKQLTLYRVVFAVLGWILSCLVVMVRYLMSSKRDVAMSGLYEHIVALRKKISSLQGDGFDPKMTVNDYKRLISIQKLGVQRSEAALREKEEHLFEDLKAL